MVLRSSCIAVDRPTTAFSFDHVTKTKLDLDFVQ